MRSSGNRAGRRKPCSSRWDPEVAARVPKVRRHFISGNEQSFFSEMQCDCEKRGSRIARSTAYRLFQIPSTLRQRHVLEVERHLEVDSALAVVDKLGGVTLARLGAVDERRGDAGLAVVDVELVVVDR